MFASNLSLFRVHQDCKQDIQEPITPSHKTFVRILRGFLANFDLFGQTRTLVLASGEDFAMQSELGRDRLVQMVLVLLLGRRRCDGNGVGRDGDLWRRDLEICIQDALSLSLQLKDDDMNIFVYSVWSLFIDCL